MLQDRICNCGWKQDTSSQLIQSILARQSNLPLHHRKQNHQVKVHVAVILIAANAQKIIPPGQTAAKVKPALQKKPGNKGSWVRLQPSVGVGFIPSPKTDVISKTEGGQTTYEYRAGNWNTALITGMGFEFGKNKQRLVNVSVNYFTGIGNTGKQTVTATSGTKTSVANLESKASGWNMRVGIPFTLADKNASKNKSQSKAKKTNCSQRVISEYKYRCRQ